MTDNERLTRGLTPDQADYEHPLARGIPQWFTRWDGRGGVIVTNAPALPEDYEPPSASLRPDA